MFGGLYMEEYAIRINNLIKDIQKQLESEELESVIRGDTWDQLTEVMSDRINTIALQAESESTIAFEMDHQLVNISDLILIPAGYDGYTPYRERSVKLTAFDDDDTKFHAVSKNGRIDSKYNNFIIEYKKHSKYLTIADMEKAEKQAIKYLQALNQEEPGEYAAMVTDGFQYQFIEWIDNTFHSETVERFDGKALSRLIKNIIKLSVKSLDAKNLINDLVIAQHRGTNLIYSMTKAINTSLDSMCMETTISYSSWLDNFGLSHDDASQQQAIEERRKDLASIVGKKEIGSNEEYRILFSLHTATAIIGMLIAYKVVSVIKNNRKEYSLRKLYNLEPRFLRTELNRIANGAVSSEIHIYNLLELNCFTWVFLEEQWTEQIYHTINDVISVLLKYENMPDLTSRTDDLFRDLYMAIMPTSVRHSLGEYYTPSWLAENVINEAIRYSPLKGINGVRVLDSAAGSGTFPHKVISMKRKEYCNLEKGKQLEHILTEVASIDANVLAVILARINYFITIADLISHEQKIYIPVFIGDSTVSNSDKLTEDKKYYVDKLLDAEGNTVTLRVPTHSVNNKEEFINTIRFMADISDDENDDSLIRQLDKICTEDETEEIKEDWIRLKRRGMLSDSMVSTITDYYLLCALGKYDMIVGNPPWVDWKSLPSVHREKIKNACVSRKLFSGDRRTGGINLNVCALLSNITAENWLAEHGVMAVLMPQNLLFQQSYEGYRNLYIEGDRRLYFQEIVDWSMSGHPFYPVQQLFCTYIISDTKQDYFKGIPYREIVLNKGIKLEKISDKISQDTFNDYFTINEKVIGRTTETRTALTVADNISVLKSIQKISGTTSYIGREGVEYYPQELQLFILKNVNHEKQTVSLETYKNKRSKYSIGVRTPEIETKYLRPLVKGVGIKRFHAETSEFIVAFPYDKEHSKIPFNRSELSKSSPLLYQYYKENREYLEMQTGYSDSIIGNKHAEYYALARTGIYSHAPWYVVFRDNTKWVSAVIGQVDTAWGGMKTPAFQNHCVSICERSDGEFISEKEAYYICGILNSHLVENFIMATSDKRTFKIRIPVKIVEFDGMNKVHLRIAELSEKAHINYNNDEMIENIRDEIDMLYLESLK